MKKHKLLPLFITSLAGIHLYNKLNSITASSSFPLYSTHSSVYKWKYGDIYYTVQGTGSPMLFIHDLSAFGSSFEWNKLVDKYSRTNTVYTLDLLGCGRSDKPQMTYTNYLFVQLITDFLENIIKEETIIITSGHSSGIGLMTALNNNHYIKNLILINPPSIKASAITQLEYKEWYFRLFHLPIIGTWIINHQNDRTHLEDLFYNEYFYAKEKVLESYLDAYHCAYHYRQVPAKSLYTSIFTRLTNFDVRNALQQINIPIYIIAGEYTPNIKETINEYLSENPAIQHSYVPDSKLLCHLEQSDECIKILNQVINNEF